MKVYLITRTSSVCHGRLLEIAQEQAAEIARLKQYTCEACADADSCDRVGRAANRQCAAFRVVTKK